MANIEVELRGLLSNEQYTAVRAFLQEKGELIKQERRFFLDYTTFLEGIGERKRDVRVRVTNGKVEIVVKIGKFGGTSREEASIFPDDQSLENTLKLMSMLGYTKAVACDRGIERYMIDGIEFAIQDINDVHAPGTIHSRLFEGEIMTDEAGTTAAVEKIRDLLSRLNLKEFTEHEFNEHIAKLNEEANGVFDYETDNIASFIP